MVKILSINSEKINNEPLLITSITTTTTNNYYCLLIKNNTTDMPTVQKIHKSVYMPAFLP